MPNIDWTKLPKAVRDHLATARLGDAEARCRVEGVVAGWGSLTLANGVGAEYKG